MYGLKYVRNEALISVITPLSRDGEIVIDRAECLVDGREYLQTETYDMLILDLVLPEHRDEQILDVNRRGGVDLLNEIYINPSIKKPIQIIGLTEFEAEFTDLQKEFKDKLWYLLYYSRKNADWKELLKAKVCQLLQMKNDIEISILQRDKYDVGIICALNEEFIQLQKAFLNCTWETFSIEGSPYVFKKSIITTCHMKDIAIVAACANKPGICPTSVLATTMYHQLGVDTIFMTGITAGVKNGDVDLDDIVVAETVQDYANGKLKEINGDVKLLKEINQIPASANLISLVSDFISSEKHMRSINEIIHNANMKKEKENITAHVVKTICGPFVISSPTIIETLQKDDRKLQALDMEGFALYFAAHTLNRKALWIKSVSDFADMHKADDYHMVCSFASGYFLYEFIREML